MGHVLPSWNRLIARCFAARLDRELATGTSPDSSAALTLRAQRLVRLSVRRDLAESVERALATGLRPAAARSLAVPFRRDKITEAAGELRELVGRLVVPGPVPARGVALVSTLLGDAGGPLYQRGSAGDLRARVRAAAAALSRSESNRPV